MAQQGCIIAIKFVQGDFEPHKFKKISCFAKILNMLFLSFIGILFLIPIEILDNLVKIFKLPGLLIGGPNGVLKVENCFTYLKNKLTGLNNYQLTCLEQ